MCINGIVHRHLIKHWALEIKVWIDPFQLSSLSQYPKTIIPQACDFSPPPPNIQPALISVLMDITILFLHLYTQSVLAWGKVSHQYILQLHSSQPQIGEIINTTAQWSSLCRNQFNQAAWLEIVCCDESLAVYTFVCFSTFIAANQASNSKVIVSGSWRTAIY